MHILLSNDDGVYAPGIIALAEELKDIAKITVVAPDRDRSAASKSLTLNKPIRPRVLENGYVSVDGTPSDCVHYALTSYLKDDLPDMVVSGINAGANLGDDVMYSGTVAAATEGLSLGLPSFATSLVIGESNSDDSIEHYSAAAKVVKQMILHLLQNKLAADTILNINIPNIAYEKLEGFEVARLGKRHSAKSMILEKDPRGKDIYWIGPTGAEADAGEGTDFYAIRKNHVALTPLEIDLTRYSRMETIGNWQKELKL